MSLPLSFLIIFLVLAHPSASGAQALEDPATRSAVAVPALGIVFDQARGVRALLGIPGASVLGEPLELPFRVAAAAVSARHDYVLMLAGEQRECRFLRLGPESAPTPIDGAAPGASRIVLSPSGSAAALYRGEDGLVQIITGLPEAPAIAWQSQVAGGPLLSMALSDDGEALLAGLSGGTAGTLLLMRGGASRPLPVGMAAALAFSAQSRDAAAVANDGSVWFIADAAGAAECRPIAGPDPRLAEAAAIALSSDGARILIASRSGTVTALALDGSAADVRDCRCAPSGLYPLNRAGLFRLNEPSRRPLVLWDSAVERPRFWFVPPDPPADDNQAREAQ